MVQFGESVRPVATIMEFENYNDPSGGSEDMDAFRYYCCRFTKMRSRNLLLLSAFLLLTGTTHGFVCPPNFCQNQACERVEECGPNQLKKPGGVCNCCDVCYTILGENEPCPYLNAVLLGAPPTTVECGAGLMCLDGTCKKIAQ